MQNSTYDAFMNWNSKFLSNRVLDTKNSLAVPQPSSKPHVFAQLTHSTFFSLFTTASIAKSKQLWRNKLFCLMSHQHSLLSVSKHREHTAQRQQLQKVPYWGFASCETIHSCLLRTEEERWVSQLNRNEVTASKYGLVSLCYLKNKNHYVGPHELTAS